MPALPLALALGLWLGILYLPGWTLAAVLVALAWAAWPQRAEPAHQRVQR